MTIKEIMKQFNEKADWVDKFLGEENGVGEYTRAQANAIKRLYEDGIIRDFQVSDEMMALANGYKYNFDDKEFNPVCSYDLYSITASKKATKAFAEYILNR